MKVFKEAFYLARGDVDRMREHACGQEKGPEKQDPPRGLEESSPWVTARIHDEGSVLDESQLEEPCALRLWRWVWEWMSSGEDVWVYRALCTHVTDPPAHKIVLPNRRNQPAHCLIWYQTEERYSNKLSWNLDFCRVSLMMQRIHRWWKSQLEWKGNQSCWTFSFQWCMPFVVLEEVGGITLSTKMVRIKMKIKKQLKIGIMRDLFSLYEQSIMPF